MTRPIVELCVHGEAKPHLPPTYFLAGIRAEGCPGGRVLEQAIIIEKDDWGNWPAAVQWTIHQHARHGARWARELLDALASAQENQP